MYFFFPSVVALVIVFIVYRQKRHEVNKRSEIIMKVLETDVDVSAESIKKLMGSLQNQKSRASELAGLNRYLLYGTVMTVLGVFVLVVMIGIAILNYSPRYGVSDDMILWSFVVSVCIAIGVGNLIVYYVMRKQQEEEKKTAKGDIVDDAAE